jgi:arylsulfatase A-like enzyme
MKVWTYFTLAIVISSSLLAAETPAARKPNIIFILADDLGYSDLGCYGSEIETPNLDALAANGLRFTQFYNTARCWPSRAALMTGYYAQQVNRDPQGPRPKWAALLPELLKEAGYKSYHSGKWHIDGKILDAGFSRSYHTTDHDRFFSPKHHQLDDQPLPPPAADERYYATTATAQRALQWLSEHESDHNEQPFFLYLAFIAPHFPLQALPEDIEKYKDRYQVGWDEIRAKRWARMQQMGLVAGGLSAPEPMTTPSWNLSEEELQKRIGPGESGHAVPWTDLTAEQRAFQAQKMAIHAAMIDRMDREIGRVFEKLRAMNAWDDTLIFFASDNGASAEQIIRGDGHMIGSAPGSAQSYLGLGPGWSTVSNTPFRRHKSWNHEGGVSTPLIAHWPRRIQQRGKLSTAPGHLVDIAPTLMELTEVTPPAKWNDEARPPLPGRSLVSFLQLSDLTTVKPIDEPGPRIPGGGPGIPAPAQKPIFFKHIENRGLRINNWKIVASGKNAAWELYDLTEDRAESKNLATEYPGTLEEMIKIWNALDAEYAQQGATGKPAVQ